MNVLHSKAPIEQALNLVIEHTYFSPHTPFSDPNLLPVLVAKGIDRTRTELGYGAHKF